MVKDRMEVATRQLGVRVFPTLSELWMYEDKHRTAYWLAARRIPHARTWIFYRLEDALRFAEDCPLPIVYKAAFGACASGVRILRGRRRLRRFLKKAFWRGILPSGFDRRDSQWGCVLLQEFLPDVTEWRMVRIGDSFFGHPKGRVGEFHSGSGAVLWDPPSDRHFEFLEMVTESAGFRSMDVDVFETREGRLLVNELQTVFGAGYSVDQSRMGGEPGRFVRSPGARRWVFEKGDWARNACANERIRYLLSGGLAELGSDEGR